MAIGGKASEKLYLGGGVTDMSVYKPKNLDDLLTIYVMRVVFDA